MSLAMLCPDHKIIHPNKLHPEIGWSDDQTLHVAAVYNNPMRWRKRTTLFNDFRRHMAASANVKLYVGEISYGDRPFMVTSPDNPLDFQFRCRDQLWHKENLLNRVINRFDVDWQYGAWIDADFVFSRHDWALEAVHKLQFYDFVQLFSTYSDLDNHHNPINKLPGFAYGHHNDLDVLGRKFEPGYGKPGSPGGAWSFTREAFNKVGSLLDTCILGSADHHMSVALAGRDYEHADHGISPEYASSIRTWQRRAESVIKGNISYIECHAIHHYHGSKNKRGYGNRWEILKKSNFNPYVDIYRDWQGLWQLSPDKPKLRDDIRRYFASRDEDGC